jgi:tRNA(fMet)-specific endonuclease VapC
LSAVAAARSAPARIVAFARLASSVRRLSAIPVVDYDADCEVRFDGLRAAGIRIGTPDLRIAATALAKGLTVATRNRRDFGQVSGVVVQDRSAP